MKKLSLNVHFLLILNALLVQNLFGQAEPPKTRTQRLYAKSQEIYRKTVTHIFDQLAIIRAKIEIRQKLAQPSNYQKVTACVQNIYKTTKLNSQESLAYAYYKFIALRNSMLKKIYRHDADKQVQNIWQTIKNNTSSQYNYIVNATNNISLYADKKFKSIYTAIAKQTTKQ